MTNPTTNEKDFESELKELIKQKGFFKSNNTKVYEPPVVKDALMQIEINKLYRKHVAIEVEKAYRQGYEEGASAASKEIKIMSQREITVEDQRRFQEQHNINQPKVEVSKDAAKVIKGVYKLLEEIESKSFAQPQYRLALQAMNLLANHFNGKEGLTLQKWGGIPNIHFDELEDI